MRIQVRNVRANNAGVIDIEINHPQYGWIWFTASPNDVEPHGRELYHLAVSGQLGKISTCSNETKASE